MTLGKKIFSSQLAFIHQDDTMLKFFLMALKEESPINSSGVQERKNKKPNYSRLLGDRKIHPHQNFINLTKIFLSHSACGITACGFEKQYYSKPGQYRLLIIKIMLRK